MLRIIIGSVVALGVGLALIPLLRRLAHRLNITDRPDAKLKPHARPIAYLGGVGFYLAWLAGLAVMHMLSASGLDPRIWLVAGVGGIVLVIGLIDDIRGMPPLLRVAGESLAAVLLFVGGARYLGVPLLPAGGAVLAVSLAVHLVLVLGACNSANLLDGLDGLCGGVCAIVLVGLALLAGVVILAGRSALGAGLDDQSAGQLRLVVELAVPMAGALLAFLRYNYRPASIFMGDAGSLLLGLLVAACLILLGVPGWLGLTLLLGGAMIFAVPIGDTMLAFVRRGLSGRPIMLGDRSHFYDQLVDRGLSVRRTVNLCYLLSAGFAVIGIATAWAASTVGGWAGLVLLLAVYAVVIAVVAILLGRGRFVRVDK